jgi:tryptophan synthase alpha chain
VNGKRALMPAGVRTPSQEPQRRAGAPAGNGERRIAAAFERARREGRAALMPYMMLGYPTPQRSLALVEAAAGGADLLELGLPFSDPLADGPVIQRAAQVALAQGITVARCLELAADLRKRKIMVPFIFMGYYNPILAFGEEAFCRACSEAGVDGLIVPDLPPEEGGHLEAASQAYGMALIYLVAPGSTPERLRLVAGRSRGFIYLVTVAGTTGPREHLPPDLSALVRRVRCVTGKPLAVGFGISNAEQAGQAARLADGVVAGSALVCLAEARDGEERVGDLVRTLRGAVTVK